MSWIQDVLPWLLPLLIALPIAGGVLAGVISNDRTRNMLVVVLAILIAAGGIIAVYSSTLADAGIWAMQVNPKFAYVGSALELAIIAFILLLSIKIKNAWINYLCMWESLFHTVQTI